MTTLLPRLLALLRGSLLPAAQMRPGQARRRLARRAVASGGIAFALLTVALVLAMETVKPEWRDPEYGVRIKQVRHWQQNRPDRPLALVFGSSRAQMGVAPGAMTLADESGSPLVYNMAYRGNTPLGMWLHVARTLDGGVRPRAVVLMLSLVELRHDIQVEGQFRRRFATLSVRDLWRLKSYTGSAGAVARPALAARVNALGTYGDEIAGDLFPDWQDAGVAFEQRAWAQMDEYGWVSFPVDRFSVVDQNRLIELMRGHVVPINNAGVGAVSDRAIRDIVSRCRAEGVAVSVVWAPESPAYRAMYSSAAWAEQPAYSRVLAQECGVKVFPAPAHLEEGDFADGYHLLPAGAAKYSAWLAETHLKPWLAELGR